LANKIRQAEKFGIGLNLSQAERYWRWASILPEARAMNLLNDAVETKTFYGELSAFEVSIFGTHQRRNGFNELLEADMQLVLPNDMLRKVDLMSMAHGLEVRVPFWIIISLPMHFNYRFHPRSMGKCASVFCRILSGYAAA
jgi:asparagine synthase (glutamine-hydrolysing)